MKRINNVQKKEKMNTNKKTTAWDNMHVKLSTLWIFVMFNMDTGSVEWVTLIPLNTGVMHIESP
jgi:hypothetical protein